MMKKYIPAPVRRQVKLKIRQLRDIFTSTRFALTKTEKKELSIIKSISQQIKITSTTQNKIHNLKTAIASLNNIEIKPGEIFSFWKLVRKPSEKKGYLKSRSILNNKLQEDVGGGLCQLSGLIYFLVLHAGLNITERHSHSIDIYKEEERFTPLGSDATVAYGYKDLRFFNNLSLPLYLTFTLADDVLTGTLLSTSPLTNVFSIDFEYAKNAAGICVTTFSNGNGVRNILAKNNYKKNFH